MTDMFKRYFLIALLAIFTAGMQAKVKLSHLVGDNMIVQQNAKVSLWGWDTPGTLIKVNVSWSKDEYSVTTDKDGKWMVKVNTPAASRKPLSITFDDGEKTTISNILAGDVWVCAGQSNMEMTVNGKPNCPVEGYTETVIDAINHPDIHYVKVPSVMSTTPLEDAQCQWQEVSPKTVGECSAVGYYFARIVSKMTDTPIGLILANKGGSRVESWLSRENLTKYTSEKLDSATMHKNFKWKFLYPMLWGNGTFNPILNSTVKGILFYQGCSNVGDPGNQYSDRLKLLAEQWRQQFGQGELPFYIVEIAPYSNGGMDKTENAYLREQQSRAADMIPHSGIVSTNDLVYPYERRQIHPSQKRQVGERLALMALNRDYGMDYMKCESPRFKDMRISNDTCYVHLRNDYDGVSRYDDIEGFEVAGEDRVFHKVKAYVDRKRGIVVTSSEVKKPVAVRYCFRNFMLGNMKNSVGLPLIPFRTDNW